MDLEDGAKIPQEENEIYKAKSIHRQPRVRPWHFT
jgi:hypothetical protein